MPGGSITGVGWVPSAMASSETCPAAAAAVQGRGLMVRVLLLQSVSCSGANLLAVGIILLTSDQT